MLGKSTAVCAAWRSRIFADKVVAALLPCGTVAAALFFACCGPVEETSISGLAFGTAAKFKSPATKIVTAGFASACGVIAMAGTFVCADGSTGILCESGTALLESVPEDACAATGFEGNESEAVGFAFSRASIAPDSVPEIVGIGAGPNEGADCEVAESDGFADPLSTVGSEDALPSGPAIFFHETGVCKRPESDGCTGSPPKFTPGNTLSFGLGTFFDATGACAMAESAVCAASLSAFSSGNAPTSGLAMPFPTSGVCAVGKTGLKTGPGNATAN